MAKRDALIVARADVAVAFRGALEALRPGAAGKIAATKYRRTTDPAGTPTYYVAHGEINDAVWDGIIAALNTATQGVRDAVDWQGKPSTPIDEAKWALASQAGEIVAGFRLSRVDSTQESSPRDVLASLGLVADVPEGAP